MIEVVVSLGILSVVSAASVWLVFTTLALRDQALATTTTTESLRIFSRTIYRAVANASVVSGTSTSLLLTSANECWSFVYDSNAKNIRYSQISAASCTPNPNPVTSFFPSYSQIENMTFNVTPLSTGGRQVTAAGVINTVLPFANYQTNFSNTVTNVID